MPRYAAKVDANHREVIDALRACGWTVKETHQYREFVDAVAFRPGWPDSLRLIEIKSSKGKLTASQSKLLAQGFPVTVLRSVADAARLQ